MPLPPSETDFRRRWYQAHVRRHDSDATWVRPEIDRWAGFTRSADEALEHVESLRRTRDPEAFRAAMQTWAVKPDTLAFNGFAGQMLLNMLVKRSDDPYGLGGVLADGLSVPVDDDAAASKIRAVVEQVEAVRVRAQPAPRSAVFLLSYLWALADRRWPIHWTSAASFTEYICGTALPSAPDERYREFCLRIRGLDAECERFERVAVWWEREHPVLVDPVLVDRCAFGVDAETRDHDDLARNAAVLAAFGRYAGQQLLADVENAAGRPLTGRAPGRDWKEGRPRSDAWADWTDGRSGPGIRVWVNHLGLGIGVKPGSVRSGWYDEAATALEKDPVPGFRTMAARGGRHGEDAGFITGANGEFLYGRFYDRDQLRTLADRAKDAPGTRHVMLIDEINRGNLPRILGELLFLLEYRGEQIGTLYRPDEAFELPPDLWFIGTMNTADRSIALIDAALRRRFHFVPVYPDSGPLEGLLRRWLTHHGEPIWVADLVETANGELVQALGGNHLQIGPSHFMRRGLDEARVERIWRYNVEPLLEDQFFGDQARIDHFRYDAVRRRSRESVGVVDGVEPDATQ